MRIWQHLIVVLITLCFWQSSVADAQLLPTANGGMVASASSGVSKGVANTAAQTQAAAKNENLINANKSSSSKSVPLLSVNIGDTENPDDLVPMLRVVAILTLVTLAPALLLLMSAFTRILIVLAFVRQALGTQTMPPNQVLIGLALFLSYFVMAPSVNKIYDQAIVPYMEKRLTAKEAFDIGQVPVRDFMMAQTRREDLRLFYQMSKEPQPQTAADVPMRILIPSFVISELKAAFQIGFLVYLPFIIIDMIVSSVLMAMGMMMLPPTVVSMPIKLVLFVLADGWNLLAGSLIKSFAI